MLSQKLANKEIPKRFLVRNGEYRATFKGSKIIRRPLFSLYLKSNNLECYRLGITVPSRFGGAVTRNRLKRIARALYQKMSLERWESGVDIHLYVGNPVEKKDYKDVRNQEFREQLEEAMVEALKTFKPGRPMDG